MDSLKRITIDVSKTVRALGIIICLLVFASITSLTLRELNISPNGRRLFYVDLENNIPTYFSSIQLLIAAGLLAVIAVIECREKRASGRHWTVLAVGFLLMSIDEISSIHEKLIRPMRALIGSSHLGIFYHAWVIPAIAGVAGLGLYFRNFLRSLPQSTRNQFLLAGLIYLGGAVGLEMLGGKWREMHGMENIIYYTETHFEESMEMFGILLFIRAILRHLEGSYGAISFSIQTPAQNSQPKHTATKSTIN